MPIDLANVNISLQQFQEISSGKFNAGEVKLASERKLAKMNNHVDRTSKNNEKISHAEVIAIKQSLVRALSQHGVGQDEIDRVRQELGLAPAGPTDRNLRFRSLVPLSRQQIREIIDRNAAAINAFNAEHDPRAGRVRTSTYLYGIGGMSAENAAKRDAVNAALAGDRRTVYMDEDIARFSLVVSDTADFVPTDDRPKVLAAAKAQLEALMAACQYRPREDVPATAKLAVPDGPALEMPTGLSEKQFAERLENMIVRFSNPMNFVVPVERDVVRQYRALETREARHSFLENLPNDPDFGRKARALAVQCLYGRGVADYATLSVANRLGDRDALAIPAGATPDEIRANPVLAAMAAKPPVRVPETERAYVPATSIAQYNKFVSEALTNRTELLLPAYRRLAETARQTLRSRLGATAMPDTSPLSLLARGNPKWCGLYLDARELETTRLSADAIAGQFLTGALKGGATRILVDEFEKAIRARGGDAGLVMYTVNALNSLHPDFVERMAEARTPADATAIVADYRAEIDRLAELYCKSLPLAKATKDRLFQRVAERLGVAPEAVKDANCGLVKPLREKALDLLSDILDGKRRFATDRELEAAFTNLADEAAAELAGRFDQVDALRLPHRTADEIKDVLFGLEKVRVVDVARLVEETRRKVNLETLEGLLVDNAPTELVRREMRKVGTAIRDISHGLLAGKKDIGPDDVDGPENIVQILAVHARPGLDRLLDAFFARPDVKAEYLSDQFERTEDSLAMESFRSFSTDPEINPFAEIKPRLVRTLFAEPRARAAFDAAGGPGRATAAGYHPSEVPALLKAFTLHKAATDCSDEEALAAVLDPRSKTSRLMKYGGRFTESPENFREGLRLVDLLHSWYPRQVAEVNAGNRDSATKRNLDVTVATAKSLPALEKFLMEAIALDPDAKLDSQDPEELFGMERNKAMRFVGRRYPSGNTNTIAAAPPAKRDLLFDVFDALDPLPGTEAESEARTSVAEPGLLIARIFRNYDAVAALRDAGNLDRAHLVPLLYGDLDVAPDADNRQLENAFQAKLRTFGGLFVQVVLMANESGATLDECADAVRSGRRLPNAPYVSSFICRFDEFDGSAVHGRNAMLGDLHRPSIPKRHPGGQAVLAPENNRFVVRFPDGTALAAKPGETIDEGVMSSCNAIADKLEAFCGAVHSQQLGNVCFALSQSAIGTNTKDGFATHGIVSDEHMPVTFTLSKDEATGAVTIRYTEPEGFPLKFRWETTVALDGTTTTTQMVVD